MINQQPETQKPLEKRKTKFQEMLDAPKGATEYNPQQSFALHVYWIVRSPRAASEMIQHGFNPCAQAAHKDTPTTMAYIFRVSKDQRLAEKMKQEVLTIGQHPHYQPSFKSLKMGVPLSSVELKLRHGGIDTKPLSWNFDEPIESHREELDFDPIVLECTEVYLDSRSFYEHGASREWMNSSVEILKPARSLKSKTYCVGTPTNEIWETTLESYLKAIRMNDEKVGKDINPGLFTLQPCNKSSTDTTFFLEFDLQVERENIETIRPLISQLQQEVEAPYMIVLPINMDNEEVSSTIIELRIMLAFSYSTNMVMTNLKALSECDNFDGRLIVYGGNEEDDLGNAKQLVEVSSMNESKLTILHAKQSEKSNLLAGYPLHALYNNLTQNDQYFYQI